MRRKMVARHERVATTVAAVRSPVTARPATRRGGTRCRSGTSAGGHRGGTKWGFRGRSCCDGGAAAAARAGATGGGYEQQGWRLPWMGSVGLDGLCGPIYGFTFLIIIFTRLMKVDIKLLSLIYD